MDCESFKAAYRKFDPRTNTIYAVDTDTDEYQAYVEHMTVCTPCGNWYMGEEARQNGHDPDKHPCVHVAYYLSGDSAEDNDPWECPDQLLAYIKSSNEYGLPVRDGGNSWIAIRYCPWCGIALPKPRDFKLL